MWGGASTDCHQYNTQSRVHATGAVHSMGDLEPSNTEETAWRGLWQGCTICNTCARTAQNLLSSTHIGQLTLDNASKLMMHASASGETHTVIDSSWSGADPEVLQTARCYAKYCSQYFV